jgi:hypothetical protein
MKICQQIVLRVFLGLNVAGLLNGCTMMRDNMAKTTTDYNLVVEKAQNEMLLLNIVRASKRRPMYFTSLSSLRGKMTYSFGTGSTIPFGKIGTGTNGSYSVTPSVSYSNSPEFDLAVLDSKKFTCGIMTPVPMKTIEYYWQQGWPEEILLYLFIHRLEIKDANGTTEKLKNYPLNQVEFKKFKRFIQKMKWDIVEASVRHKLIGKVDANDALKLDKLVEVQKAGLMLREGTEKDKKELCLNQIEYVFTCMDPNDPNVKPIEFVADSQSGNIGDKSSNKVYLRSPEAILYYLGELVRVENSKTGFMLMLYEDGPYPAKLFYALKVTTNDKAHCVSVDYEGDRYVIPQVPDSNGYCTDHSMHVLSLVSQLIGLQKEVEETPVTGVVSVIGQ